MVKVSKLYNVSKNSRKLNDNCLTEKAWHNCQTRQICLLKFGEEIREQ